MMEPHNKVVINKRIPIWLWPLRYFYRAVSKRLFTSVRIIQVQILGLTYLVWANEDIGKRMIFQRTYEQNELQAFALLVKSGDKCVDVGGNVGIYALNLARLCLGVGGRVLVIEPIKKNRLIIELAAEINGFKNIDVYPYALSDAEGFVDLHVPGVDGAYAFIGRDKSNGEDLSGHARVEVRSTTLDLFLAENSLTTIDVLKIDVEGAEKLVLDGCAGMLSDVSRRPRVIMAELVNSFLGRYDSEIEDVIVLMQGYGYGAFYALPGGRLQKFTHSNHDKVFNVFFVARSS